MTIDSLSLSCRLYILELVKLDIQGFELEVLRGLPRYLVMLNYFSWRLVCNPSMAYLASQYYEKALILWMKEDMMCMIFLAISMGHWMELWVK